MTTLCANQNGPHQGCNGFCIGSDPQEFEDVSEFFETCKSIPSLVYPGLCEGHFQAFNLVRAWTDMPDVAKSLVLYLAKPETYPLALFEMLMLQMSLTYDFTIGLMLSPTCFWVLNEAHFGMLIRFGYINIKLASGSDEMESNLSYVFVLEAICKILPWVLDGGEDLQTLRLDQEDLIAIKWSKIMYNVCNGFIAGFGPHGLPRMFPRFGANWKEAWEFRANFWIQFYSNLDSNFPGDFVEQLLAQLIECVETVAELSLEESLSEPMNPQEFQQTVLEYAQSASRGTLKQ